MDKTKFKCKLCGMYYSNDEMSEEHYPARSVGNEDIVALDIIKMFDSFQSKEIHNDVLKRLSDGENADDILGDIFDTKLSKSLYPAGQTVRKPSLPEINIQKDVQEVNEEEKSKLPETLDRFFLYFLLRR